MTLTRKAFIVKVMIPRKYAYSRAISLLIILGIIISIIFLCNPISTDYSLPRNGGTIPPSPSRELTLSEFDYFVNTEEGKVILEKEFEAIETGKRRPWTIAELPANLDKNRYNDLLAYDETRVVLETLPDDPFSDYINANYIDGQNRKQEYVATQGPLPNTVNDFWRMIWQLNSTKIAMLTNLVEHGERKVEKYWPEETEEYGNITVTKIQQDELPNIHHVIRTFSLQKGNSSSPRIVRHFHFTGWPDLSVPTDRLSVVALIQQIRKYKPDCKAPIVLHCSAGVGRTGTVILTDSMMQKAMVSDSVNFPEKLDQMRVQRVDVVEKKGQYVFAHQAVYDFLNGTNTESYLRDVDEAYKIMDGNLYSDRGDTSKKVKRHINRYAKG